MNLYFIRHGQTEYNVRNVFQGRKDIPLNENGIQQAEKLSEKFENISLDAIVCSPLIRARQTAEPLAKKKKLPINLVEGLIERSFGDMEGCAPTEEFNIQKLCAFSPVYKGHEAEDIEELVKRAIGTLSEIEKEYKGKNVAVVSHGNLISAMIYCLKEKLEEKSLLSCTLENGEIKCFRVEKR